MKLIEHDYPRNTIFILSPYLYIDNRKLGKVTNCEKTKLGSHLVTSQFILRKMRDSNPRYPEKGIPDFESSAFGHSANLPFTAAKVAIISETTKLFQTLLLSVQDFYDYRISHLVTKCTFIPNIFKFSLYLFLLYLF